MTRFGLDSAEDGGRYPMPRVDRQYAKWSVWRKGQGAAIGCL